MGMRRVYKYAVDLLQPGKAEVLMHPGTVLSVGVQDGFVIWADVDPQLPKQYRFVVSVETGAEPPPASEYRFLGTQQAVARRKGRPLGEADVMVVWHFYVDRRDT
jgi:hypothetical protein